MSLLYLPRRRMLIRVLMCVCVCVFVCFWSSTLNCCLANKQQPIAKEFYDLWGLSETRNKLDKWTRLELSVVADLSHTLTVNLADFREGPVKPLV